MTRSRKPSAPGAQKHRRKKTDGPPEFLAHEVVVATALELLDEEGLDRFSMRRLADRLGVTTMAAYYLFESKGELLASVYQHAFAERPFPEPGGTWLEEALRIAHWIRAGYLAHPTMVALRNRVDWPTPAAVLVAERWLAVLQRAGLSGPALAQAYYASTAAVLGIAEQEALNPRRPVAKDIREAVARAPLLSEALPRLEGIDRKVIFERSIELLLVGLVDRAGTRSQVE